MKRLALFSMILTLVPLLAEEEHKQKPISLTATVVDTGCYMAHDSSGADHKTCALTCAKKGVPLALVDESGKVYSLIGMDHQNPNAKLLPFIEKKVKVEGTLFEKGGSAGVWVKTVTEAK